MFKAFTDNISSLISGGDDKSQNKDEQKSEGRAGSEQGDTKTDASSSSSAPPATTTKQEEKNHGQGQVVSDEAAGERRDSKSVPPPRPAAPPLTPASSVCKPGSPESTPEHSAATSAQGDDEKEGRGEADEENETKLDKIDEKLDEMAEKAKQWGSYLFSVTKMAGASVSARAKELKKAVEEKTILGDFAREQDKFVSDKKEKARASEAAVPPWVGYNEEEQMKTQMLNLSNDKRNFLRNPPAGVQFHFDYETCYPVAMATLAEDEKLQKMRFELVPKLVAEPNFWRNYFYRVSLIKQSTQLTSLAKQSGSTAETEILSSDLNKDQTDATTAAVSERLVDDSSEKVDEQAGEESVQATEEFISDAYNLEITDEDLEREMQALRASPSGDIDWEKELQKELTDYEVVGENTGVDDDALEKEIMDEIEASGDLK